MLTGKLKYVIYGVLSLVFILVCFVAYRMFFMFDKKKVAGYVEQAANTTTDPNTAYKIINEMVQSLKKSQDATAAIRAMAIAEKVDKELKLVETALFKCYSLGFLEAPAPDVQYSISDPNGQA